MRCRDRPAWRSRRPGSAKRSWRGLKPLDRVAYIRYASVYRNFQDIDQFQEAVAELIVREQREGRRRFQGELPLPLGDQGSSEDL